MQNKWKSLYSLYIHWPFCPYRCSFCPFVALAKHDQFMERYHHALCKEIDSFNDKYGQDQAIKTIFLGGGTPSTWPDQLLLDMFDKLRNVFSFANVQEITIEVNPGTVRREQLTIWKQIGINRLSIGVQSLDTAVLWRLNRRHTKDDVYFLLKHASVMFENISIDLILGLPGVDEASWKALLKEVVTWPIKHISVYCLTIHEETKLYFDIKQGITTILNDDCVANLYEKTVKFLDQQGFVQYEISNFARVGYESIHNNVYWDRLSYKGFGLGACSFEGLCRSQNQKLLMDYLKTVEKGDLPVVFEEYLTDDQVRLENIMLAFRTNKGISYAYIMEGLSSEEKECCVKNIQWLKRKNLVYEFNGYLVLTPKGMIVEHEIVTRFFQN